MLHNGSYSTKWNSGKSSSRKKKTKTGISFNSLCLKFSCFKKGNLKVVLIVSEFRCKVFSVLKGSLLNV